MEDESICQRNPWFIRSLLEYFFGLSLGVLGQNLYAITGRCKGPVQPNTANWLIEKLYVKINQ